MAGFEIAEIRRSFPALDQNQVFFDNAGGSQTLGTVIDSIRDYLSNTNVQLGATYHAGKQSTERYGEGYAAAARYINASQDNIVLGSSTTQLYRNLSCTLNFPPGDELVISGIDHEANIAPWVDIAERQKLAIKWWLPSSKIALKLTPENLSGLLSEKTRLVALTHASNILGTIHDIKAICEMVHAKCPSALVCVDAVAYAPHHQIDVQALGVDIYAFSWYKVYGPHMAMLYANSKTQEQMRSLGHFFNPRVTLENKLGLGGASYELTYSIKAVTSYMEGKFDWIKEQEQQLLATLLDYLNSRGDITIYGEKSSNKELRVPTVSFTVEGWNSKELVEAVEKDSNIGFRWGSFYSKRLVEEFLGLGKEGIIRVSMVHYNTVDEVKSFIAALENLFSQNQK